MGEYNADKTIAIGVVQACNLLQSQTECFHTQVLSQYNLKSKPLEGVHQLLTIHCRADPPAQTSSARTLLGEIFIFQDKTKAAIKVTHVVVQSIFDC